MKMSGERRIAAPRTAVWAALNDPEVLKVCIPGCREMVREGDGFSAVVTQKIGPVSATFKGGVALSNVVEGKSYTISGEGKSGAAGFAKGKADVTLADREGGTLLAYGVEAKVGGKIAQLGGRLIDGVAKKMADRFFNEFQDAVGGETTGGSGSGAVSPIGARTDEEGEDDKGKGWFGRMIGAIRRLTPSRARMRA